MGKYILSQKSEEDLKAIWRNIAPDNERAADGVLTRILDKIALAAGQPFIGSPRTELSESARILIEGRYIIIYEPMPYGIFVVSIVHGGRDMENWLN